MGGKSLIISALRRYFCYHYGMKMTPVTPSNILELGGLSATELLALVAGLQQQLQDKDAALQAQESQLHAQSSTLKQRERTILLLEELLRLKKILQYAVSIEKSVHQTHLFDEAKLDAEIDALRDQLPDDAEEEDAPKASRQRRQRGFSDTLVRERIELTLSEEEKVGTTKTCFTKAAVYSRSTDSARILAEKAVFERGGDERIIAAPRPVHPLGKCTASTSLLTYLITARYADGLPLYRLESIFKRTGHEVSRTPDGELDHSPG